MATSKTPEDAARWDAVEEATELLHEERYQDALYLLRDVVKADPGNPYGYYFIGAALYELGQLAPARDAYQAAVRLSPGYVGARGSLAQVLRLLKDFRGALREAEETLRLAPDDPDALHALGLSYAALGNRGSARHYLEAFLRTRPEFEAATEVARVLEMLPLADGPLDPDD